MALKAERRAELAAMTLPPDRDVAERAAMFRQQSGMTAEEFSRAIGYASSTLHVYLNGHYSENLTAEHDGSGNTRNIRAALVGYMDKWQGVQLPKPQATPHRTSDFLRILGACDRSDRPGRGLRDRRPSWHAEDFLPAGGTARDQCPQQRFACSLHLRPRQTATHEFPARDLQYRRRLVRRPYPTISCANCGFSWRSSACC